MEGNISMTNSPITVAVCSYIGHHDMEFRPVIPNPGVAMVSFLLCGCYSDTLRDETSPSLHVRSASAALTCSDSPYFHTYPAYYRKYS